MVQMEANKINGWKRVAIHEKAINSLKDNASLAVSESPSNTRRNIKYGSGYEAAWAIFSEYCNNSTIHGIKYLGEKKRPLLERLFWICVFVLSIYACFRLTTNIWNKWDTHPVIVSFAEKSTPVWQIPFPTVTVCSETKSKPHLFSFENTYWRMRLGERINLSSQSLDYMESVTQVCDLHLTTGLDFGFENKTVNVTNFFQSIHKVAIPFNETFSFCKWRNKKVPCDSILQRVITEEGICYSFNALSPQEIYREEAIHSIEEFDETPNMDEVVDRDLETGYKPDARNATSPKRVFAAGARIGLHLLLQGFEADYDNLCRGPVQGFKIALHPPGEVSQVSRQYFRIPFNTEVLISVKPNIITTTDGLKYYDPIRRQCFFQRERYLRYFKLYTQINCEVECLANFTLERCGCVQFSMPRTVDTPVCGAISIECLENAAYEMLRKEFEQGRKSYVKEELDCNCLPACTSIIYNAEISQADIGHLTSFNTFKEASYVEKPIGTDMSRLFVFFKAAQFLTSKRSELYGTTDFFANCGGLLGLFMGISSLSIIELIYFFSIRLVTNLKMRRRNRRISRKVSANAPQIVVDDTDIEDEKPTEIQLAN